MPDCTPGAGAIAVAEKKQTHKKQSPSPQRTYIVVGTHPDLRKHDHLTHGRESYIISKIAHESNCMK